MELTFAFTLVDRHETTLNEHLAEGWREVQCPYEILDLARIGVIDLNKWEYRSLDLAISSLEAWREYGDDNGSIWVRLVEEAPEPEPEPAPQPARLPIATPHHSWRPAIHTPGTPTPWVDDEVPF